MDALTLTLLGRRLARIGAEAMHAAGTTDLPRGVALVLADAFAHPGSSIREITERTGLRQSYVSESVARLRAEDAVEIYGDPEDGRRTLVYVTEPHRGRVRRIGSARVDDAVAAAFGPDAPAALSELAGRLEPRRRRR